MRSSLIFASALALFFCAASTTSAQENPPTSSASAAEPPASGLGQQAGDGPGLRVVYPRTDDVVNDVVSEVEDLTLTPEQRHRLKALFLELEREKATPYLTPPKPITRTVMVNLDPGVSPPVLRLARGQQTSLVFADMTGQPWYVEKVVLNRQLFTDGKNDQAAAANAEPPTNVLSLEPMGPASYGNVTITLRGLATPVIFILTSGQDEVDMRVDAHVPGRNPDAADLVALQTLPQIDLALSSFLDGVPPKEARRLKLDGAEDAAAWAYHDQLYVRTPGDAQYPAYISAARSTSGLSVYKFAELHSSVTILRGGRAITLFIQ